MRRWRPARIANTVSVSATRTERPLSTRRPQPLPPSKRPPPGAPCLRIWTATIRCRARWLSPYTDVTLSELPLDGVRHVQVLCPGFSVDCLETLEEIALTNHARFLHAGGEKLEYIPALNDSADHVAALADLVLRNTAGWPEFAPDWDAASATAQATAAKARFERLRDAGR